MMLVFTFRKLDLIFACRKLYPSLCPHLLESEPWSEGCRLRSTDSWGPRFFWVNVETSTLYVGSPTPEPNSALPVSLGNCWAKQPDVTDVTFTNFPERNHGSEILGLGSPTSCQQREVTRT